MDKRLAGLFGAAAALTAASGAQAPAQSTEVAPAASYRELLDPSQMHWPRSWQSKARGHDG
jgi:hypothetical protein